VAGQHDRGREPSTGARPDAQWAAWETGWGANSSAARRRMRATNAPAGASTSSSGSVGSRPTNLIPRVRPDEHGPVSQPRRSSAPRLTNIPRLTSDTEPPISRPRQTNGSLRAASAAPEAPYAPTKKPGPSTPWMETTPTSDTIIIPALADDGSTSPTGSGVYAEPNRRRRRTTARPVRPEDTTLVNRQTMILNALEAVIEDARVAADQAPTVYLPTDLEVVDDDPTSRLPVTVVPAGALAPTPIWLQPRRRGQRSLVAGFVVCLMTLALVVGVLVQVNPLASASLPFGLLGAQTASNNATGDPSGPWDTQAGAVLGLGGGAGPGVKAPGSAGLPAKSSGSSGTPSGGSSSSSKSGISPAPVRPWPPRWAYMYVPGHPSFKVSRPKNGFYWWAFGQCTWWAQYKRQDENLRHMGNARYWAAGAASRGYRVGHTPRAGATVVFQPGVEGAGGAGHVAHVEKVYPGGWFLVSEMNFYWNGGGWGRVSYRFVYVRSGVSFIY
jgi:surface antigen